MQWSPNTVGYSSQPVINIIKFQQGPRSTFEMDQGVNNYYAIMSVGSLGIFKYGTPLTSVQIKCYRIVTNVQIKCYSYIGVRPWYLDNKRKERQYKYFICRNNKIKHKINQGITNTVTQSKIAFKKPCPLSNVSCIQETLNVHYWH